MQITLRRNRQQSASMQNRLRMGLFLGGRIPGNHYREIIGQTATHQQRLGKHRRFVGDYRQFQALLPPQIEASAGTVLNPGLNAVDRGVRALESGDALCKQGVGGRLLPGQTTLDEDRHSFADKTVDFRLAPHRSL